MTDVTLTKPSSASETVTYSVSTPTSLTVTYNVEAPAAPRNSSKDIERAVYSYLRAVRALGRTELNVSDVAGALHIATPLVVAALSALRSKGVKFG
jgi:hypothetical protein